MTPTKQETSMIYARHWGRTILPQAVKVFFFPLLLSLLSFILTPILMAENITLRIASNVLLIAMMLYALGLIGAGRGQKDAQNSMRLAAHQADEKTCTKQELADAYHPLKGIVAALLGALPWFLCAVALALLAQPYTYQLQDLPSYLSAYLPHADTGAALTYYGEPIATTTASILRVVVRLVSLPYINAVGTLTDAKSLLLDRLSPLLVLALPAAYAIGYQFGPFLQRRTLLQNEAAKAAHQKKVARKRKKEKTIREKKKPEQLV